MFLRLATGGTTTTEQQVQLGSHEYIVVLDRCVQVALEASLRTELLELFVTLDDEGVQHGQVVGLFAEALLGGGELKNLGDVAQVSALWRWLDSH